MNIISNIDSVVAKAVSFSFIVSWVEDNQTFQSSVGFENKYSYVYF